MFVFHYRTAKMSYMTGLLFVCGLVLFGSSVSAKPESESYVFSKDSETTVKDEGLPFSFASYYGDHMVLQVGRNVDPKRAILWGHAPVAAIGQGVHITIEGSAFKSSVSTNVIAGPDPGTAIWKAKLPPIGSFGPYVISATMGSITLKLLDVLFGDVWVCSGQSNMQFSMIQVLNATKELSETNLYPDIRVLTAALKDSKVPLTNLAVAQKWSIPSPATIGNKHPFSYFSAVCWLYGKYLYQTLGYPIGLVDADWGGTRVEAWSSPDALAKCGIKDTLDYKQPREEITPMIGPNDPSVLWNAVIHPLLSMTIYGAIWYQGEANSGVPQCDNYNCTFPNMIYDWRKKFNEGSLGETSEDFPFGFVQLCGNRDNDTIVQGFSDIRWHQTADYGYVPNPKMPNVFMSVAMDLPDFHSPYGSVHPRDKQDVAHRLALSGLSVAYNRRGITFQGPLIRKFYYDPSRGMLAVEYDNEDYPIVIRKKSGFEVCCSKNPGDEDTCLALDPRWKAVSISKSDFRIVTFPVKSCTNMFLIGFRYAWRESPCQFKKCAVYSNDLPAPPFIVNGQISTWQQQIQTAV